jgi:hypothetical protein
VRPACTANGTGHPADIDSQSRSAPFPEFHRVRFAGQ